MFRIFIARGRSVQGRSPSTLRCLRPFHSTVSTPQRSSTAEKPVEYSVNAKKSSLVRAYSDSPPSLSKPSTNTPSRANGSADSKINQTKPRTPRTRKSPKLNHDAADNASSTPVTRRAPRKPEGFQVSPVPEESPASEPCAQAITSNKSQIEQSENPSADSEPATIVENRFRKKLFTSQNVRDDILPYLKWVRGGNGLGKSIGDNRRLNIVSKPLCDDIIKRLEPSLQKHIGCDIIEVNPGVGVWSEKLHHFLKPRTHILLEPDQARYQLMLQPLLDAPGSKYTLVPKSGVVWGHLEKVLSKEYLPHQEAFERGDPRLENRNDSLLFVANLGYHPRRAYRGFPSIANLVLYQFLSAIRAHSLFQRYGLVRMLIWIESEERNTVLPRSISLRRKSAIEAEISCEKIQEIASSTDEVGVFRRENHLELESTRSVYEKMKEMGVSVPTDRESTFLKQLHSGKPRDVREGIFTRTFLEEINDLETRLAAGEFNEEVEVDHPKRSPHHRGRPTKKFTPQFARLRDLRYRQTAELGKYQARNEIKRRLDEIYSLQRKVQVAEKSERHALEEDLRQRTDAWKEAFSELPTPDQESISVILDNTQAVRTNPPTLMWDRREVEPLKVHPAEFYPHQEMCLLDFQPKSIWPILQENFPENCDVLEYIIGQLLIIPTQTIKRGLSALAPGAYDYLIAECPSLTDPTKGGSLDVELMTVRRLTEEMFKEIIEAWVRWPFKPTKFEVMSRMGSAAFDPDNLEAEALE